MLVRLKPYVETALRLTKESLIQIVDWCIADDSLEEWNDDYLLFKNSRGNIKAELGDWIIFTYIGDIKVVDPEIFKILYERIE